MAYKGGIMSRNIKAGIFCNEEPETEAREWEKFYVRLYLDGIKNRNLLINTDIDDDLIEKYTLQLIEMDKVNHEPITVYINSNGGDIYESFNFTDIVSSINSPVKTICLSHAFSSGFIIFMSGEKRVVYKNSILMMHPIKTWFEGENVPSVLREALFLNQMTKRLAKYFAERTSRSENYWEKKVLKSAHDVYFFPEEALKLGIATEIVEKQGDNNG
jgi:ATP-dependent Clp protease, protease subunit